MFIWGKLLGGFFGFLIGGFIGALFGVMIGHLFDRGMQNAALLGAVLNGSKQGETQRAFFVALFSIMGHVAKADGRVSPDEIAMARGIMQQMSLDEAHTKEAIDLFNQGKQPDFDLDAAVDAFRLASPRQLALHQMFMEVLIHAAYADGQMDASEEQVLRRISERLGFAPQHFAQMDARVRAQRSFHEQGHAGGGAGPRQAPPSRDMLRDAYEVLGVSETASDTEVKKAYRRQMNQHHPDKLVARGMPEEMIKMATAKTQEIKAAYDTIKKARDSK